MIPIVAMLTNHQQKMARLMRENREAVTNSELEALRREVGALKSLMHQQMIALDNLSGSSSSLNGHHNSDVVRTRLEQKEGV